MSKAAFVYSEELADFDYGDDHPFKPIRARNTRELCHRYGLLDGVERFLVEPSPAPLEILELFHERSYLEALRRADPALPPSLSCLSHGLGTQDCPLMPGLYEFCRLVVGATLLAVDLVKKGEVRAAFNPVGGFHHGGRAHAEGFCYVNDAGVAIERLLGEGLRVAHVDIDAHHGNGVQDAFYGDDRVLSISVHESGETLYPWGGTETEIGAGRGLGFNVNVPLLARTDDEVYVEAFRRIVPPLLDAFHPDIVLAQVGADSMISDPLTHLRLTNNGYRDVIRDLVAHAPKIAAMGGGGYDIYRTARCWTLAWAEFAGVDPEDDYAALSGGAMHGAEMEPLLDRRVPSYGPAKEMAREHANRVVDYLQTTVFPVVGAVRP